MDRPRDKLLADAAFAPDEDRRMRRRHAGNGPLNLVQLLALTDQFRFDLELSMQLPADFFNARDVLLELLPVADAQQMPGHLIRHRERELQLVGVERPDRLIGIEVDHTQDAAVGSNRRTDGAADGETAQALPVRESFMLRHIMDEHRLLVLQHQLRQVRRESRSRRSLHRDRFEEFSRFVVDVRREQQHRGRNGPRSALQTGQHAIRERRDVRRSNHRLGELKEL